MSLILQTRRAVITLSLLLVAIVCIAAKTALPADQMPMRAASMAQEKPDGATGRVTVRRGSHDATVQAHVLARRGVRTIRI